VAILALGLQQAHAWKNIRFGAGVNFECQSGGNSFGWGLCRSAQPPAPARGFAGPYYAGAPSGAYVGAPVAAPVSVPAPGHAYQGQPAAQSSVVYYTTPSYQPYQTVNLPGYYPAYGR
jgi:hypothetical protein